MKLKGTILTDCGRLIILAAIGAAWTTFGDIALESNAMRIRFGGPEQGYAIQRIENRLAGDVGFLDPSGENFSEANFWSLTFKGRDAGTNAVIGLSNRSSAADRRMVRTPDGGARFIFEGLDLPGEKAAADVTATVSFTPSGTSEWRIEVTNRSRRWTLYSTCYPMLRRIVPEHTADVLLPSKTMGASLFRRYATDTRLPRGRIPSPSSCPMIAAFMLGEAGLYFGAHDEAYRRKYLILPNGRYGMNACFDTPVENAGVPGRAAEGPRFAVTVACFKGDWWQAASIYRDWALKRPCVKGRIIDRTDYPEAMAETDIWALGGYGTNVAYRVLKKVREIWSDLRWGIEWTNWQVPRHRPDEPPSYLCETPDIWPAQEGVPEAMAAFRSAGATLLPYVNGRLWDTNAASYAAARSFVCTYENGSEYREPYGRRRYGVMCPYTPLWQEKLAELGLRNLNENGANGIYYDQVSCSPAPPCSNPAHGHPLVGGSWWVDGYRKALESVHRAYCAKNAPITSEQGGDYLPDVIDGYLFALVPRAEDVPFWPAVYSGYLIYHGTRVLPNNRDGTFFAMHARSAIWGVAPGWMFDWMLYGSGFPSKVPIVTQLGRFRRAAKRYMSYGSLVGDLKPLNPLPRVAFDFNDYSGPLAKTPCDTTHAELDAVIGAWWRSADGGNYALAAANVSEAPQTVRFSAPVSGASLVPEKIPGWPLPTVVRTDAGEIELTLAPRTMAFLCSDL